MSIKITVSNKVGFKVKGEINDAAGVPQAFDFSLICKRLDAEQIREKLKNNPESSVTEFLVDVVEDWSGVRDGDDKPLPYNEGNLRALCKIPGIDALAFRTYMAEVGAKEKN